MHGKLGLSFGNGINGMGMVIEMFSKEEIENLKKEAEQEFSQEKRREKIDSIKEWMRRPLLKRLFPYKISIKIEREDNV